MISDGRKTPFMKHKSVIVSYMVSSLIQQYVLPAVTTQESVFIYLGFK